MGNLLDELYQKDTQTRIATGGARGIDPTIVENAREAELSDMNRKAAVGASQAENIRQNRLEEKLTKNYMKDQKLAQGLEAASFLGTTYLGTRKKPTVKEQPLNIKPVYLSDHLFDVKLYDVDNATGQKKWNTQLMNNIWPTYE
jgi:outer membrane protein assembly factor BamB